MAVAVEFSQEIASAPGPVDSSVPCPVDLWMRGASESEA